MLLGWNHESASIYIQFDEAWKHSHKSNQEPRAIAWVAIDLTSNETVGGGFTSTHTPSAIYTETLACLEALNGQ